MSNLPKMSPPVSDESAPFWDATAEEKLVLPKCNKCGFLIWYPRAFCPECHTEGVTWVDASGRGTVYARTIVRSGGFAREPYVVAYVELEEGPRILTNVIDCDPDTVNVGDAVVVSWDDTEKGPKLPRFKPA